jgi:hypothetical protein
MGAPDLLYTIIFHIADNFSITLIARWSIFAAPAFWKPGGAASLLAFSDP